MTFISYAQNFEDVLLWRALQDVPAGFYIDVGAWHPDTDSVTRAFYDRGWHGINIEPVADTHRRLRAARPRDLSLAIALGAASGEAVLHVAAGSGLSSLYPEHAARAAAAGFPVHTVSVPQRTLAEICAAHAPADIHFLKIDAEGAEQAVLEGADFAAARPWIVLLEAVTPMGGAPTFSGWEPILLRAGYHFVWFDGLNRFYVAAEHHARLAPHFAAPPNVFDDFIRAGERDLARLVGIAEQRALAAEARAAAAEQRLGDSTHRRIEAAAERLREHAGRLDAEQRAVRAEAWLEAVRSSTSWRLLGPLRRARHLLGRDRVTAAPAAPAAPPRAAAPPPPPRLPATPLRAPLRTVHQFHSGSARHDAITPALFLTRDLLRGLGYTSEIYVEHRDPSLAEEIHLFDALPAHADYVLLAHHSLGFDAFADIAALPAAKLLVYHNITPPEWLAAHPKVQANAVVGRTQLAAWRGHAVAALADSDYNARELRALGFDPVRTCTLLFDLRTLQDRAARTPPVRGGATFTLLFVGRIAQSKGQDLLVQAFAAFRRRHPGPSRLVLVGAQGGDGDPFLQHLVATIRAAGLAEDVLLTGLVSDDELDACYAVADLYVSLSHHEGFGVPLVEAMAHGLPVLAWPAGAVPDTLGAGGALLDSQDPEAVGARIAQLAANPERRAAIAAAQTGELPRFALDAQLDVLREALLLAGAAPPSAPG
jgi:FkbM family methyltransferase